MHSIKQSLVPDQINISWTRYLSYKNCKLQYCLRYVDHVKMPPPRSRVAVGSAVHDTIRDWAQAGYPRKFVESTLPRYLDGQLNGLRLSAASRAEYLRKAMRGALVTEQIYRLLGIPDHKAIVEERYDLKFPESDQLSMIGGPDVYDPATCTIYDLKLSTSKYDNDPEQLLTYSVAMNMQHRDVEYVAFVTPLLKSKLQRSEVTAMEIQDHRERLVASGLAMLAKIQSVPEVGNHCFMCEYYRTSRCRATYRSGENLIS